MDVSLADASALPATALIGRLALAILLGSAIGFERSLRDKPAGFRTNVLICIGACVFTIASQALGDPMVDKSRIAAQIVSGVGFLGAGAIIRDARGVVGLTTAATIWAVAAVGMAAGFGETLLAVAGTVGVLIVLWGFPLVSDLVEMRRDLAEYRVKTQRSKDQPGRMEAMFVAAGLKIAANEYFEQGDDIVFSIKALGPRAKHETFRAELLRSDEFRLCEM